MILWLRVEARLTMCLFKAPLKHTTCFNWRPREKMENFVKEHKTMCIFTKFAIKQRRFQKCRSRPEFEGIWCRLFSVQSVILWTTQGYFWKMLIDSNQLRKIYSIIWSTMPIGGSGNPVFGERLTQEWWILNARYVHKQINPTIIWPVILWVVMTVFKDAVTLLDRFT